MRLIELLKFTVHFTIDGVIRFCLSVFNCRLVSDRSIPVFDSRFDGFFDSVSKNLRRVRYSYDGFRR